MRKRALQFLIILILVSVTLTAHAGDFKNIVVFGDTLSDNGNLLAVSGEIPPAPYYKGRFSDGPVWVEYLVEELGIQGQFYNYAHGGAQTGDTNVNGDFPGFLTQITSYVNMLQAAQNFPSAFAMPEDTLFIVFIGSNDFLGDVTDPAASISQGIENIQTGMTELIEAGAVNFLVGNLADFGKAPKINKNAIAASQVTQVSVGFNQALKQLLAGFEAANPGLEIKLLDTFSFLCESIENYEALGFTNAVDAQLDTEQGTIAEGTYIFWDDIHTTTKAHKLFADYALQQISCESCKADRVPYFEDGLKITVPYIELEGNAYGFKLLPYANSNEEGLYWMFDVTTLTVE